MLNGAVNQTLNNNLYFASINVDQVQGIIAGNLQAHTNGSSSNLQTNDFIGQKESIGDRQSASVDDDFENESQSLHSTRDKRTFEGGHSWQQNSESELPPRVLAMIDVDEWQIHPTNIHIGQSIGKGYWGSVHKALVKSSAIKKLQNTILSSLKDKHIFAAVKILKGLLIIVLD